MHSARIASSLQSALTSLCVASRLAATTKVQSRATLLFIGRVQGVDVGAPHFTRPFQVRGSPGETSCAELCDQHVGG